MTSNNHKILPVDQSIPCNALKGIRVVEMGTQVAAPVCARMLGDYGAEVIKVERPEGDSWRITGSMFLEVGATEDANPMFDVFNSGKKSVVLDLKKPEDKEKLFKLLETADVFITNTRMKALKKLGIDPETVRERIPGLIFALITGYGIDGPDKDEPGFDSVSFFARSGLARDIVYAENSLPMATMCAMGDVTCGMTLLSGVLAALVKKAHTGMGDFVTTSLLGAGIWNLNNPILIAQPKYGVHYPLSNYDDCAYGHGYECADGEWIRIGVMDYDRYVPKLFEVLGIPEMINDPRFKDDPSARKNMPDMVRLFEERFKTKTCAEWIELIKGIDVVCHRLVHFRDVGNDEQAWANGNLEEFTLGNGDTCMMPCPPVRFGSTGTIKTKLGPRLGEHTEEVLNSL